MVLGMAATGVVFLALAAVILGQTFGRLAQTSRRDGRRVSDDPSLAQLWRYRNVAAVVGAAALVVAVACSIIVNLGG